jgi:hypothetical protein
MKWKTADSDHAQRLVQHFKDWCYFFPDCLAMIMSLILA